MKQECPRCHKTAVLSDKPEQGVNFNEPICKTCRNAVIRELLMDEFDRQYARLVANGWGD